MGRFSCAHVVPGSGLRHVVRLEARCMTSARRAVSSSAQRNASRILGGAYSLSIIIAFPWSPERSGPTHAR
jgi:hypothetical protein